MPVNTGSQKHVTWRMQAKKIPDSVVTWSLATCSLGIFGGDKFASW